MSHATKQIYSCGPIPISSYANNQIIHTPQILWKKLNFANLIITSYTLEIMYCLPNKDAKVQLTLLDENSIQIVLILQENVLTIA